MLLLAGAAGLVGPALLVLHYRWIVPVSAGLLVLVLVWLHVCHRYSDDISLIAGAALVAVAVLRSLPFAFNR